MLLMCNGDQYGYQYTRFFIFHSEDDKYAIRVRGYTSIGVWWKKVKGQIKNRIVEEEVEEWESC
jgi:hypothetical protein